MNRRVILCPNPTKDDGLETSRRAKAILEEAGFEVCICPEFVDGRPDDLPGDLPLRELEDVIDGAALVVSLGGDGTIMHTARRMMGYEIPIIGVNLGTMGFMAELDRSELEDAMAHPELQEPDPEFDAWCDRVIAAMEQAKASLR